MTRRRAWLAGAGLTATLTAAGCTALLLREPPPDRQPHPFNQDRNAVWLEHRWLTEPQVRSAIEAKARSLARHGVLYAFPHLIPFERSGRLPPHDREQMRSFLEVMHSAAPRIRVLPWVGGLRVGYKRTRAGTIDLGKGNLPNGSAESLFLVRVDGSGNALASIGLGAPNVSTEGFSAISISSSGTPP